MKIEVKIVPASSQQKVEEDSTGFFKIWLHAKPIDGAANEELVEILSGHFHVAKSLISIVSGAKSRTKIIEIYDNRLETKL